jgi:hypothetical protein
MESAETKKEMEFDGLDPASVRVYVLDKKMKL